MDIQEGWARQAKVLKTPFHSWKRPLPKGKSYSIYQTRSDSLLLAIDLYNQPQ